MDTLLSIFHASGKCDTKNLMHALLVIRKSISKKDADEVGAIKIALSSHFAYCVIFQFFVVI